MDIFSKNLVKTARPKIPDLVRYMNMHRPAFDALSKQVKGQKWWDVLGIEEPTPFNGPLNKNKARSLETIVSIFRLSPYLDREDTDWIENLIAYGQVTCSVCSTENTKNGLIACSLDKVERHLVSDRHKSRVQSYNQPKITQVNGGAGIGGMTPTNMIENDFCKTTEALIVGLLAAGGDDASGIPSSSIPALMNKDLLDLIRNDLQAGLPSKTTILTQTLVKSISIVKGRIKTLVKDTPISLYIDGGSAYNLADSRKVIVICASSMKWKDYLVLDVSVHDTHENSEIQTELIEKLCETYDILPRNIHYICADNASLNKATVEKLNRLDKGFNISYARCLPHCLNLVVNSFLTVMDSTFKMSSHLKLARRFLTAGGGVARKLLAVEFAISVSGLDVVDTRWASVVYAICNAANVPSLASKEKATKRLQELADRGDVTAKAALEDTPPEREVFYILYDLFESVSEAEIAGKYLNASFELGGAEFSLSAARAKLLKYYAQPQNFLAFQVINIFFNGDSDKKIEKLKTVMSITQGNPNFVSKMTSKESGVVPDCVHATKHLITRITSLHYPWAAIDKEEADYAKEREKGVESSLLTKKRNVMNSRARIRERLDAKMKRICDVTIAYYKHINAGIKDQSKPFDEVVAAAWREAELNTYNNITVHKLLKAVHQSVKAVVDAEGLVKTMECLRGLELSQVFDVNKRPKDASDDDETLLKHIGGTEHEHADHLLEQWRAYVTDWTQPKQLSPMQVYQYWESKTDDSGCTSSICYADVLKVCHCCSLREIF
jgi:hypothetical protein